MANAAEWGKQLQKKNERKMFSDYRKRGTIARGKENICKN